MAAGVAKRRPAALHAARGDEPRGYILIVTGIRRSDRSRHLDLPALAAARSTRHNRLVRLHRLANTVGFDDAPFPRDHRGAVKVVGAVFADRRFDGVLVGAVEKDGSDAADVLATLIVGSRFHQHINLVLLQGVAVAGFNVVDAVALRERIERPVLVVARRRPDMSAIRRALESGVPGGQEKWRLIERLGPMEACAGVYVQRIGLTVEQGHAVIERLAIHSQIPEPLRVAHLIAGALASGASRGRP